MQTLIKETIKEITYEYSMKEAHVDFACYDVVGIEGKNTPLYEKKGGECGDFAYETDQAQPLLSGIIKWDECAHFYYGEEGYIHHCGDFMDEKVITAIKTVRQKCKELLAQREV